VRACLGIDLRQTPFTVYQIEVKPDSMAMPTDTSGVDYGRYATYHTLKDLSNVDPELWVTSSGTSNHQFRATQDTGKLFGRTRACLGSEDH
jgi:hypothetical protein